MAPLDLNIGLWFDCFTKIDSILVPDTENISSELLTQYNLVCNLFIIHLQGQLIVLGDEWNFQFFQKYFLYKVIGCIDIQRHP